MIYQITTFLPMSSYQLNKHTSICHVFKSVEYSVYSPASQTYYLLLCMPFVQSKTVTCHFILTRDSEVHTAKEFKTLHSDSNQSSAKPDVLKSSVIMVASLNTSQELRFVSLNYGYHEHGIGYQPVICLISLSSRWLTSICWVWSDI